MIGETVVLRALSWIGEAPYLGDYLCAGGRARFAYRIVDVRLVPARDHRCSRYEFHAVREKKGDVPPFARVHRWRWASRAPRGGRTEAPALPGVG